MQLRFPKSKTRVPLDPNDPEHPGNGKGAAAPTTKASPPAVRPTSKRWGMAGEEVDLPIDLIDPPAVPLRKNAQARTDNLTNSLHDIRLLARVAVKRGRGDRYEIICGERRYWAAKQAGWTELPCLLLNVSDVKAARIQLRENLDRRPLSKIEIGRHVQRMCRPIREGGLGVSMRQLSYMLGKSRAWAAGHARLLKLPPQWQERADAGQVSLTVALALVPHRDNAAVMAACEADFLANPYDWKDQKAGEQIPRYLAEQVTKGKAPRSARTSAARPDRRDQRRDALTEAQARRVLARFARYRGALETLARVIQELLGELPAEN